MKLCTIVHVVKSYAQLKNKFGIKNDSTTINKKYYYFDKKMEWYKKLKYDKLHNIMKLYTIVYLLILYS